MPRYFFDIRDQKGLHRDDDGVECDDAEDARMQARTLVADVIREQVPNGDQHEIVCEVRKSAEEVVYRVKLTLHGTANPNGKEDGQDQIGQ